MAGFVSRPDMIKTICNVLQEIPDLKLVRPYHGELDRYSKKTQLKSGSFPMEVQLVTPFALVISKNRERLDHIGSSVRFRHEISIYVGMANTHSTDDTSVLSIFNLTDQIVQKLHGRHLHAGCGVLNLISDGDYLITTDLFTVYDMKFYQYELCML